jgi:lactate dehydrogenase-like 2-hydroxyacid dehydrogenase
MIERGDWQVSEIARNAFDLEGKVVGTIGAGRIGYRVLQRLVPFDCKELLYYDYAPLPAGNYSAFTTALRFCLIISYIPQLLLGPSKLAESRTLK